MPLDYDDWKARADRLRRQERWEEALLCYDRSLDLNPGDTVSKYDLIGADQGRSECLRRLIPKLKPLLAALTPQNARDHAALQLLASNPKNRRSSESTQVLGLLLDWVLAMEDSAFERLVSPLRPSDRPPLPITIIRRSLSKIRKLLPVDG